MEMEEESENYPILSCWRLGEILGRHMSVSFFFNKMLFYLLNQSAMRRLS